MLLPVILTLPNTTVLCRTYSFLCHHVLPLAAK